jgi:tetratricopeptide (TPR) repeat protein
MKRLSFAIFLLITSISYAQIDKISFSAGSPEDKDLNVISQEKDIQKRTSMYEDFLQKYGSSPMAVAYTDWQLSQLYEGSGDLPKAAQYSEKALQAQPKNLDILTAAVTLAKEMNDNAHIFNYAVQGGEAYASIDKQIKPAEVSQEQFDSDKQGDKDAYKSTYLVFQNVAYAAIGGENDPKMRMNYVERFTAAFPNSGMDDQLTTYAIMALAEMRDNRRLVQYANKALEKSPDNMPALLLLANMYVDSNDPAELTKAITYAQRAIVASKAEDPAADKNQKTSAGVGHAIMGRVYTKQGKTQQSILELKSATTLLKGEDEQQYAIAAYFLGWDYAKLNKLSDARAILTDAANIPGAMQPTIKELLTKVNSARAAGK